MIGARESDGLRLDVLTGDWVAVTPRRRGAGGGGRSGGLPAPAGRCPFCPGHEADTEEAVAVRPAEGPWRVRVVRNLYPLAVMEPPPVRAQAGFDLLPTLGEHEVLVESPDHDADLADLTLDHASEVLETYRDRVAALSALPGIAMVVAFRNRGRRAGSSQPHPHGQIAALPVVGPDVARRDGRARASFEQRGERLLDAVIARELAAEERIVEAGAGWVTLCPFAPRSSYQTWVVPRTGVSFGQLGRAGARTLSAALLGALRRLRHATGGADYNLILRLPPVASASEPQAFWYVDLIPRRGGDAGFELSTGMDVVTVTPERAAAELRAAPPGG